MASQWGTEPFFFFDEAVVVMFGILEAGSYKNTNLVGHIFTELFTEVNKYSE